MIGRALLMGGVLATVAGLTVTGTGRAEGPAMPAPAPPPLPMILNLVDEPVYAKSREKAFIESIKRDVAAPKLSPLDDWEPQPDGSMRNRRSGVRLIVRNPCPPGDGEHELALAAYNRAAAGRPRR